jgi:hypothetical protein
VPDPQLPLQNMTSYLPDANPSTGWSTVILSLLSRKGSVMEQFFIVLVLPGHETIGHISEL